MKNLLPLNAKIYIAGHRGLVGSAILRRLKASGFQNLVVRNRAELDLCDQKSVFEFFEAERPEYVFLAAAKVGGIMANIASPADFIADNIAIPLHVIQAAHRFGARKLLNLGSSCVYPRLAPQPLKEEYLLTGPVEETNRSYAIAKIAAIELCDAFRVQHGCDFISAMPSNVYGPGDNFDLQSSHVLPALMRKMHEAKLNRADSVTIWGSGKAFREFLYVEDLADACLFLMNNFSAPGPLNVGMGQDITIVDLAQLMREVVGFQGDLTFDSSKPDGMPRKVLDVSRLSALGWTAQTTLRDGVEKTYAWFLEKRAAEV